MEAPTTRPYFSREFLEKRQTQLLTPRPQEPMYALVGSADQVTDQASRSLDRSGSWPFHGAGRLSGFTPKENAWVDCRKLLGVEVTRVPAFFRRVTKIPQPDVAVADLAFASLALSPAEAEVSRPTNVLPNTREVSVVLVDDPDRISPDTVLNLEPDTSVDTLGEGRILMDREEPLRGEPFSGALYAAKAKALHVLGQTIYLDADFKDRAVVDVELHSATLSTLDAAYRAIKKVYYVLPANEQDIVDNVDAANMLVSYEGAAGDYQREAERALAIFNLCGQLLRHAPKTIKEKVIHSLIEQHVLSPHATLREAIQHLIQANIDVDYSPQTLNAIRRAQENPYQRTGYISLSRFFENQVSPSAHLRTYRDENGARRTLGIGAVA